MERYSNESSTMATSLALVLLSAAIGSVAASVLVRQRSLKVAMLELQEAWRQESIRATALHESLDRLGETLNEALADDTLDELDEDDGTDQSKIFVSYSSIDVGAKNEIISLLKQWEYAPQPYRLSAFVDELYLTTPNASHETWREFRVHQAPTNLVWYLHGRETAEETTAVVLRPSTPETPTEDWFDFSTAIEWKTALSGTTEPLDDSIVEGSADLPDKSTSRGHPIGTIAAPSAPKGKFLAHSSKSRGVAARKGRSAANVRFSPIDSRAPRPH